MEEKQMKKVIIIGNKEKVSPKLLENIKEHYGCEIEVMSREEYANSDLLGIDRNPEIAIEHLFEKRAPVMPEIETLDFQWKDKKLSAPHCLQKIGCVHQKMSFPKKQFKIFKRGR